MVKKYYHKHFFLSVYSSPLWGGGVVEGVPQGGYGATVLAQALRPLAARNGLAAGKWRCPLMLTVLEMSVDFRGNC